MPKSFLAMSPADRREALNIAASQTGRPANLLEKDVWVVQALDVLYSSKFGPHLVFKGGTALSKVHRVIDRFSEDVDITYDIRELAPDETAHAMERLDVIPENRSQQSKLSALIREERLPEWIKTQIVPRLKEKLSGYADLNFQHESDTVLIEYLLAEQMGTSVRMIENHYGHVDIIKSADRVLKGMEAALIES